MSGQTTRLGMLTPSSNTVLEPVCAAMLADIPGVTTHFSRFRVTQISLSSAGLGQFDADRMLPAAELLADAKVDAILWNGTSAAWVGFGSDERLCADISTKTGIPASSSVLAYRDIFERLGLRRIGLVTPYTADVQARIQATWRAAGFDCTAERHAGLSDNFAFSEIEEAELSRLIREVAAEGVDAVAIVCTNLAGARVAPQLEAELGIPVLDSVAVTLWQGMRMAGRDTTLLGRWGRLFADTAPGRAA